MGRDDLTIDKLLTQDRRKEIAEKLLKGDIEDVVIVYWEGSSFTWLSTIEPSHLIGVGQILTRDAWEISDRGRETGEEP